MKFNIDRNILLEALQRVSNAISTYKQAARCSALSSGLYRCFIFHTDLDILTIEASNPDMIMTEAVSIGNLEPEKKAFAIDARTLLKAIKSLEGQSLEFEILEYQVVVRHSTGCFALPLDERIAEYDCLKKVEVNYDTAHYLEFEAPGLKSILDRCAYAIAQDNLRPAMNGIVMNMEKDYTDFTASDGHKLIRIRKPSIKTNNPAAFIFPKAVISALRRTLPKTGFAEMWFNEYKYDWPSDDIENRPPSAGRIVVENTAVVFRPIEGRYPSYNSVIPEDGFTRYVTVNRQALIKSVERLSLFGNESSGLVTAKLTTNKLSMVSEDKDFGTSAEETLPCDFDGEDLRIGLKDYSLLQTLRNLNTTEVLFKITDYSRAIIITPSVQPQSEEITALLMPMLIGDYK